jgi:hypothetical protein
MEKEVVGGGEGIVVVAGVSFSVGPVLVQPAESAQSIRPAKATQIRWLFINSPLIFLYF